MQYCPPRGPVQMLPVPQAQSLLADATREPPEAADLAPPGLMAPLDRLLSVLVLVLLAALTELAINRAALPLLLLVDVVDE